MNLFSFVLVLFGLSFAVPSSAAGGVGLESRLSPGSTYPLSLRVDTRIDGTSPGVDGSSRAEEVSLLYRARVTVLDVDANGRAARELHQDVSLTFERPDERGSMFKPGTRFEVRRVEGIEIHVGGDRLPAAAERVVVDVLAKQFDHTLEPALLAPDPGVELGHSWRPDASLTRRFLLSRGVRVLELGDDPTATIRAPMGSELESGSGPVIEYRIPIERFELREMPRGAEVSSSNAVLEGRVHLSAYPDRLPVSSQSELTMTLNGTSSVSTQTHPWGLRSSEKIERRTDGIDSIAAVSPVVP